MLLGPLALLATLVLVFGGREARERLVVGLLIGVGVWAGRFDWRIGLGLISLGALVALREELVRAVGPR